MKQQKVWDSISDLWSEYRQKPRDYVVEFLKDKKGNVLDYGCGSGRNFVKQDNLMFYGVDFSLQQLKYAEENAKKNKIKVDLQQIKSEKLSFEDNFFDACLFVATLHCIETPKKRRVALEEIYRTLKKGSQMVISVWNKESNKFKDEKGKEIFMPWKFNGNVYERYYYLYDKEELKKLLENVGFKIIKDVSDKMNIVFIVKS